MSQHPPLAHISPQKAVSAAVEAALSSVGLQDSGPYAARSKRPDLSDYQSNAPLRLAKSLGTSPTSLAAALAKALEDGSPGLFDHVSVDGPGFVNIRLSGGYIADLCQLTLDDGRLGCGITPLRERIVLDYGGPNVAKAMHVGHLRSLIIGSSLYNIFSFAGFDVISDVHLGDWGTQMGMLIHELSLSHPHLAYFDVGYEGNYPPTPPVSLVELEELYRSAAERCKQSAIDMEAARVATAELQAGRIGYRVLWKQLVDLSLVSIKKDFELLKVDFDLWWGESSVHDRISPLVNSLKHQGIAEESEGAVVIQVQREDDAIEIPPLILLKTDGAVMYGSTDLATIDARREILEAERIFYIVDQRQSVHFQQVFRAAERSHIFPADRLEHIGFGTVNGPDGRPFKTRTGGAMKLRELILTTFAKAGERLDFARRQTDRDDHYIESISHAVGNAALRFADLISYRLSSYNFDLDKFLSFEGKTGPYLLYSVVRIRSILAAATADDVSLAAVTPFRSEEDRLLQLELIRFAEAFEKAVAERAPNILCEYGFGIAQSFSRFYAAHHILSESDVPKRRSWLALCKLTERVLTKTLELLAIEPVAEM